MWFLWWAGPGDVRDAESYEVWKGGSTAPTPCSARQCQV